MENEIEDNIIGKEILYQASPAMFRDDPVRFTLIVLIATISLVLPWFIIQTVALTIGIMGMTIFAMIAWWWKVIQVRVIITNSYIRVVRGIFDQSTTQIFLKDITKFNCTQSVWQRFMNTGRIEVSSSASSETEIEIDSLPNPRDIMRIINVNR